jgi:hypothetical protein
VFIAGKETKFRNVGEKPGTRNITRHLPDGTTVTERLPRVPFVTVVDNAGVLCNVPLHNGGANDDPHDEHRRFVLNQIYNQRFVPVEVCPQVAGYRVQHLLPVHLRNRTPCAQAVSGALPRQLASDPNGPPQFLYGHYCACIKELIEFRRKIHEAKESKSSVSVQDRIAKMHEESTKAQVENAKAQAEASRLQAETNARLVEAIEKLADRDRPAKRAKGEE